MSNLSCNGNIKADNLELNSSFKALKDIGVGFEISDPVNVGIELGRKDGTLGTPYIDFHTDGNSQTDYNSRLLANGNKISITAQGGLFVNDKQVVTIEQINFASNGYVKFGGGLIFQWMSTGWNKNSTQEYMLPIKFPNAILGMFRGVITDSTNGSTQYRSSAVSNNMPTGNQKFIMTTPNASGTTNYIFAIGY